MASSLFSLRAWQSFSTISLQVFFGLPLGLAPPSPPTSYSTHFFTQSLSSFCSTCPYHCNLFCCSTKIMSSNPSLFVNPLLGTLSFTLMLHIHLTLLISATEVPPHFSFLWARSHFHPTYYFAHNCCTISLSHTHNRFTARIVQDYPGEPASER